MHLAYIWIVSHLSAENYRNWWKLDEVLTKTNLLSFFGTRCSLLFCFFVCVLCVLSYIVFLGALYKYVMNDDDDNCVVVKLLQTVK